MRRHHYEVYTGLNLLHCSTDDYDTGITTAQQLARVHSNVRLFERGRLIVEINSTHNIKQPTYLRRKQ